MQDAANIATGVYQHITIIKLILIISDLTHIETTRARHINCFLLLYLVNVLALNPLPANIAG